MTGLFAAMLSLVLAPGAVAAPPGNPPALDLIASGNAAWQEHSYANAVAAYSQALAQNPHRPDALPLKIRLVQAYIDLKNWQKARDVSDAAHKTVGLTRDDALMELWRARLYWVMDHTHRGKVQMTVDPDPNDGDDRIDPVEELHRLQESSDKAIALLSLERARVILLPLIAHNSVEHARCCADLITVDLELATCLALDLDDDEIKKYNGSWGFGPGSVYTQSWPRPRRVMYLISEAESEEAHAGAKPGTVQVRSELARAEYVMRLRGVRSQWIYSGSPKETIARIPYLDQDPVQIVEAALNSFPTGDDADAALLIAAKWCVQKKDCARAATFLTRLIKDFPLGHYAKEARKNLAILTSASLYIEQPGVSLPDAPIKFTFGGRNVSSVRFSARRIRTDGSAPAGGVTISNAISATDVKQLVMAAEQHTAVEWTVQTHNKGDYNALSEDAFVPRLQPGFYMLEARDASNNAAAAKCFVLITDISVICKSTLTECMVTVLNAFTGAPLPGAHVRVTHTTTQGSHPVPTLYDGVTDRDGLLRISYTAADVESTKHGYEASAEAFAFSSTGSCAFSTGAQQGGSGWRSSRLETKAVLTLDRSIYRAGQTVYFHGSAVSGYPGEYSLLPLTKLEVNVSSRSAAGSSIPVETDANGGFSGSFTIPREEKAGPVWIYVSTPKRDPIYGRSEIGSAYLEVKEFRKPEFIITVTPMRAADKQADTVPALVNCQYFYGSPVRGARIHFTAIRETIKRTVSFDSTLSWFEASSYDHFKSAGNALYSDSLSYTANNHRIEGDAVTGANGNATINLPRYPLAPSGIADTDSTTYSRYLLTVSAEDSSRRKISASRELTVDSAVARPAIELNRAFVLPGEPVEYKVGAFLPDMTAVSANATVTIMREVSATRLTPPKDAWNNTSQYYRFAYAPVSSQHVRISGPGTPVFAGKLMIDEPGNYRIRCSLLDGNGGKTICEQRILVYGSDLDSRLGNANICQVVPDKAAYEPGETARLLLITPRPGCSVLVTTTGPNVPSECFRVLVPGRSRIVEAPISSRFLPNCTFTAQAILNGLVVEGSNSIRVLATNRILNVSLSPDRQSYKPGGHIKVKVAATGAEGSPVSASFSLSAVDAALDEFGFYPGDARVELYGAAVHFDDRDGYSICFKPRDEDRYRIGGPDISAPHLPDSLNWMANESDYSGNRVSDYVPIIKEDLQNNRSSYDRRLLEEEHSGYVPPTTGASPENIFVVLPPRLCKWNDSALYASRTAPEVKAVEFSARLATPGDDAVASILSGRLKAARLRRRMLDTAFWAPVVNTNANGEAVVEFNLPDNLTTWDLTAHGITSNASVGYGVSSATVSKNLIAHVLIPRFTIAGDVVTVSTAVRNNLKSAVPVRVELILDGSTSLDLHGKARPASVRNVVVNRDSETLLKWPIRVNNPGRATITVIAQTAEESDAEQAVLPVLPRSVLSRSTKQGSLGSREKSGSFTFVVPQSHQWSELMITAVPSPAVQALRYVYGIRKSPDTTDITTAPEQFEPFAAAIAAFKSAGIDLSKLSSQFNAASTTKAAAVSSSAYSSSADANGRTTQYGLAGIDAVQFLNTARELRRSILTSQLSDGSWKNSYALDSENGDPGLTAKIVLELLDTKELLGDKPGDALDRAVAFLNSDLSNPKYASSVPEICIALLRTIPTAAHRVELANLLRKQYAIRSTLSTEEKVALSSAMALIGDQPAADLLLRNVADCAVFDASARSVRWSSGRRFTFSDSDADLSAQVLIALLTVRPRTPIIAGLPPGASYFTIAEMTAKWLVDNRTAFDWEASPDTYSAASALLAYANAAKEVLSQPGISVEIDGKARGSLKLRSLGSLQGQPQWAMDTDSLKPGVHSVQIRAGGEGKVYWRAVFSCFDSSQKVDSQAGALKIDRSYHRVVPLQAHASKLVAAPAGNSNSTVRFVRSKQLGARDIVKVGDLIEVTLTLCSNDFYPSVTIEDIKPAGFELVSGQLLRGEKDDGWGTLDARDTRTDIWLESIYEGARTFRYLLRAETPGAFHVLPAVAYSHKDPTVRANSNSTVIEVRE